MSLFGDRRYLIAFESTHAAFAAQKKLAHLDPLTIPTPGVISASCGICLCFAAENNDAARALVDTLNVEEGLCRLFLVEGDSPDYSYTELL